MDLKSKFARRLALVILIAIAIPLFASYLALKERAYSSWPSPLPNGYYLYHLQEVSGDNIYTTSLLFPYRQLPVTEFTLTSLLVKDALPDHLWKSMVTISC